MIRLRTWIILAAVLVLAVTIGVGGPRLLRWMTFFRVRQVEVIGARYLDEQDVVVRLHLRPNASTFDALGPTRAAARAIPGVITARVERRLPGTLRVIVQEASPVAIASSKDRLVLLDRNGHVLPFDPVRAPTSLPIVDFDSGAAALLGRLAAADPLWYGVVESAHLDGGDLVLEAGTHRVRLRPDADLDMLRAVTAVRGYLETSGLPWQEIDARYRTRVFVRKGQL